MNEEELASNDNLENQNIVKNENLIVSNNKEDIKKVIYGGIECEVSERNNDELLLKIKTEDYLSGKQILINQWVKIEAATQIK